MNTGIIIEGIFDKHLQKFVNPGLNILPGKFIEREMWDHEVSDEATFKYNDFTEIMSALDAGDDNSRLFNTLR